MSWSAGYALFALLCATIAWRECAAHPCPLPQCWIPAAAAVATIDEPPGWSRSVLWCALAATGSVLLLVGNEPHQQNIAAVPLLWVVPLTLYLLTFILCFESTRWYPRELMPPVGDRHPRRDGLVRRRRAARRTNSSLQLAVFCIGLFIACMFCHGELARLKPPPRYLTRFYLMVSLGGAIGAALVGIVAPFICRRISSSALGLIAAAACSRGRCARDPSVLPRARVIAVVKDRLRDLGRRQFLRHDDRRRTQFLRRLRVQESGVNEVSRHRTLMHGTIMHGLQYLAPQFSAAGDELLHDDVRHRPAPGNAASEQGPTARRRDRPRHRHACVVRDARRSLPLLRHQSCRDPDRPADFTYLAQSEARSRRRSATRA